MSQTSSNIGELVSVEYSAGKFLTTDGLAYYLAVNLRTVYRLIKGEGLPTIKVGRQYRSRDYEIETWLNEHRYPDQAKDQYTLKIRYDETGRPIPLKTMDELAEILRVNRKTVGRLRNNKGLPAFVVGRQVRFDFYLLNEWLSNQQKVSLFQQPLP